jgi:hypothetical protein
MKYFEIEGKENYYLSLVKRLEKDPQPTFLDDVLE